MKRDYLILAAAAGAALYLVNKAGGIQAAVQKVVQGASEVLNPGGGRFSNGWRYFSDGTAIDPFGRYYKSGQLIWTPPVVKKPASGIEPIFDYGLNDA